jgi:hypothetical protein
MFFIRMDLGGMLAACLLCGFLAGCGSEGLSPPGDVIVLPPNERLVARFQPDQARNHQDVVILSTQRVILQRGGTIQDMPLRDITRAEHHAGALGEQYMLSDAAGHTLTLEFAVLSGGGGFRSALQKELSGRIPITEAPVQAAE